MKVVKKTRPQVTYSAPALAYVVIDKHLRPDGPTRAMIKAVAERVVELWVVMIDDSLRTPQEAAAYDSGYAGVFFISRGDFLRRMAGWSAANKPAIILPATMVNMLEPYKARLGSITGYKSVAGLRESVKQIGVEATRSARAVTAADTTPRPPGIQRGLTLFDIKKPTRAAMQSFLAKWSATSLNRPAFLQLLDDAASLYSIPVSVLVQLAKWEFYGLTRQIYSSNAMGGYNKHYAGPFQIGELHYSDTRSIFAPLFGVKVPYARTRASLGVQVASSIDYVRRAANGSRTLARSPMTAIGFYVVHNQGPGGAVRVINNKLDAETRTNLKAQSSEVKAALRSAYGVRV